MGALKQENWDALISDPLGVAYFGDWWAENRDSLDWKPIATYEADDIVVLRAGDRWTYGWRRFGQWSRFTEGASYPLDDFEPTEWARPSLDDAIALGME
jgi:hypothetical protein